MMQEPWSVMHDPWPVAHESQGALPSLSLGYLLCIQIIASFHTQSLISGQWGQMSSLHHSLLWFPSPVSHQS